MSAVVKIDIGLLGRICGLFGSSHDGERAAAAAHADRIVRGAGLASSDVLAPKETGAGYFETSRRRDNAETSWRRELSPAMTLATYGPALTGWERYFLAGLVKQHNWTPRQREVPSDMQGPFQ